METIAAKIDRLSIVNIKIFFLENEKRDQNATDATIAAATRKTNNLNVERSSLMEEIDLSLNKIAKGKKQKIFGSNKMYGKRVFTSKIKKNENKN